MLRSQGFEYGVRHFLSPKSGLLSDIVSSVCTLTTEEVRFLLNLGAIYLNSTRICSDEQINEKDYLRIHTKPRRFSIPTDLKNNVLFDNEDFLVVHKPAGSPCHASVDNRTENLHFALQSQLNTRLHVTTRLDVPTEGVLIYAKSEKFLRDYNRLAKDKKIKKIYFAAVEPSSPLSQMDYANPLHVTHYLESSPKAPKIMKFERTLANDQICELKILSKLQMPQETRLQIELITGRTHQIRAQLSLLGAPIIGDSLYSSKVEYEKDKIKLTACSLKFSWVRKADSIEVINSTSGQNDIMEDFEYKFSTNPTW